MKYCAYCSQCLADSATVCPVCGHSAEDATVRPQTGYDPGKYARNNHPRFSSGAPTVTVILIAVNVVIYLANFLLSGCDLASVLSMHRGAVAGGQYWRILTSMFTHEEFFHLASNMYALYIYGTILEPALGKARYLAVYFAGGIVGNVLTFALMPNPSIGASGAIFGLLGAVIAIHFIQPSPISRRLFSGVISSIVLTTVVSIGGNINNIAHFGGLAGGYAMTAVLCPVRFKKRLITSRALCAVVLCLILVFGMLAGYPRVTPGDEADYGRYTAMVFFARLGALDTAERYAVPITSGVSHYKSDAYAAIALARHARGDDAGAESALAELLAECNRGNLMYDDGLYEALMKVYGIGIAE